MTFRWRVNPERVLADAYEEFKSETVAMVHGISWETATEIENWMKQTAAWRDRTGDARATLFAEVQQLARYTAIVIGHGVPYGFWLETVKQGRYSILRPALDKYAPILFNRIQAILDHPRTGDRYRYNISGGRIRRLSS